MEFDTNQSPHDRPVLPVSGEIVGVLSILLGVLVSWRALQWASSSGLLFFVPMLVVLVHAGIVVSAILFLQGKGIGRQLLVTGLWCSALMQVPLTFIVLILAFSPPSQGGLIKSYNTDDAQGISLSTVLIVVLNIFTLIGAISLHRRSVRDAMEPPYIGFIRGGSPNIKSPEPDDE